MYDWKTRACIHQYWVGVQVVGPIDCLQHRNSLVNGKDLKECTCGSVSDVTLINYTTARLCRHRSYHI